MSSPRSGRLALPMILLLGAIVVLASTPVAQAGPCSRVRSGNSITIRTHTTSGYSSCAPQYSNHRSYGYRNSYHHHRPSYRSNRSCRTYRGYSSYKPRSSFSIRIGGSYGNRCSSYDYGYRNTYHYPLYRSTTVYRPVYTSSAPSYRTYDTRPSTGSVYTTSSADRYRDWQRTERVTERPTEPLLPRDAESERFEDNLREANEFLNTNEEPPLGSGSTPTSGDEEFVRTRPDELASAWNALLDNDASRARTLFADAARSMPKKGEARLGYVIASLRDNDRRAAAVSMVRLLESEPQLVRGGALPASRSLQDELARQSETLKAFRDASVKTFENRMLVAFVALLRGDTAEAQEAMRRARSAGAEGIAARNLWRLVGLSDKPLERVAGH